jgi:hypothetical protein
MYPMARRPATFRDEHGRYHAKITLSPELWALLNAVGQQAARTFGSLIRINSDDQASQIGLAMLMRHVDDLLVGGDADWLPDRAFAKAIATLKGGNFGAIPSTATSAIDLDVLHKNPKLKSGYEGVYANGQGFRAMGRDISGKTIVIGTYQSPEEAAHRRYMYHRANNLAYGELAAEMERWRKDTVQWGAADKTDEELIAEIKRHAVISGTYDVIFGPGSCTIEPTFSKRLPKREEVLAKPPPPAVHTAPEQPAAPPRKAFKLDPDDVPPGWATDDPAEG